LQTQPGKLITRLLQLMLLVLLPVFLIWSVLSGYYGSVSRQAISDAQDRLNLQLDRLEAFHSDETFFHALLQQNFARVDASANPDAELKNKMASFRRFLANRVRFIVWNPDGSINTALSDEKRFQFILKSMYQVMHLLADVYRNDPASNPAGLQTVAGKINLLRGYFGQFLFENQLFEPLKPGTRGKCLFVSLEKQQRLLWYYPGRNFSLACFLDAELTGRFLGPQTFISQAAKKTESERPAMVKTLSYEASGLPASAEEQAEIMLEIRKFEADGMAMRESHKFLVNVRQASPDLLLVSYLRKNFLPSAEDLAARTLGKILSAGFCAAFFFSCLLLRHPHWCLSVKHKMLLLFVFSNGLPLLLMLSAGYEFFHEKRSELLNSAHQESLRVLKEFDLRFPESATSLAARLNTFVDERNRRYGSSRWPDAEIDRLKRLLKEIRPQEGGLLEDSENYSFYISNTTNQASKMGIALMQGGLDFFSQPKSNPRFKSRETILEQISSTDKSLYFFLAALNRFSTLSTGDSERLAYLKFTGAPDRGLNWGLILLSWEKSAFIRDFIGERLQKSADELKPRTLAVMESSSEKIFSTTNLENPLIKKLMLQTRSRRIVTSDHVEVNGKAWLFTSIAGNEIAHGILAALYPADLIDRQIFNLQIVIGFAMLLTIIILRHIIMLFATRLLAPVESLARGIEKVKNRDYSVRVPHGSDDELGLLVDAFNQTVEGLHELSIGTTVQVGLLPAENYRRRQIKLFARSLFMSKMGGDYFDYFDLPGNRLGVFFGDVAGHGIPAAMIMAMMKAMIAAASKDFPGPAEVLFRGSQILQELKKRDWRRMMTAQCLDFDCQTGSFVIANAGHCYPAIIGPHGETAELMELKGFPLGSSAKNRSEEKTATLKPGETMILYTDGIIEATNKSGEMFGYPRFLQLLKSAWNEDLEIYWQGIHAGYRAWAENQDDDLTFLMLRREEKCHD